MRSLDARLKKLEKESGPDEEIVVKFISFSDPFEYPSEAEQRSAQAGKKEIIIHVPWHNVEQEA
jgi:hypothetical protein